MPQQPGDAVRESLRPGHARVDAGPARSVASLQSGETWQPCVDAVLEDLAAIDQPDLLLIFVDSAFQADYGEIAAALWRRSGARHLIGASGQSVIGSGVEAEGRSAIAALALRLPGATLTPLPIEPGSADPDLFSPLASADADVWLLFLDPFSVNADNLVGGLQARYPEALVMGGMASAVNQGAGTAIFIDDQVLEHGGALLGLQGVGVRSVVAQGAEPLGQPWIVTEADANLIKTLGSRPAIDVLRETLEALDDETRERAQRNLLVGLAMDEYREAHGRGDFLIRNILGVDQETGGLAINEFPRVGQSFQFQIRDADAADDDLRAQLRAAEAALEADEVVVGALLCSCNGRGQGLFGSPDFPAFRVQLITEIGPVGGITFVHGFTASIALLTAAAAASDG